MTEPKPKLDPYPVPKTEGGEIQPSETPAAETGMVGEGEGSEGRAPAERERPGGMIGEG